MRKLQVRVSDTEPNSLLLTDKILLPDIALKELLGLGFEFPIFFLAIAPDCERKVACSVLEFTAPPNTVVLSQWLAQTLEVRNGNSVVISSALLPTAELAIFKPLSRGFYDIEDPEAELVQLFEDFGTLTAGVIIAGSDDLILEVVEVRPGDFVAIRDVELKVEFAKPDFDVSGPRDEGSKANEISHKKPQSKKPQSPIERNRRDKTSKDEEPSEDDQSDEEQPQEKQPEKKVNIPEATPPRQSSPPASKSASKPLEATATKGGLLFSPEMDYRSTTSPDFVAFSGAAQRLNDGPEAVPMMRCSACGIQIPIGALVVHQTVCRAKPKGHLRKLFQCNVCLQCFNTPEALRTHSSECRSLSSHKDG